MYVGGTGAGSARLGAGGRLPETRGPGGWEGEGRLSRVKLAWVEGVMVPAGEDELGIWDIQESLGDAAM